MCSNFYKTMAMRSGSSGCCSTSNKCPSTCMSKYIVKEFKKNTLAESDYFSSQQHQLTESFLLFGIRHSCEFISASDLRLWFTICHFTRCICCSFFRIISAQFQLFLTELFSVFLLSFLPGFSVSAVLIFLFLLVVCTLLKFIMCSHPWSLVSLVSPKFRSFRCYLISHIILTDCIFSYMYSNQA